MSAPLKLVGMGVTLIRTDPARRMAGVAVFMFLQRPAAGSPRHRMTIRVLPEDRSPARQMEITAMVERSGIGESPEIWIREGRHQITLALADHPASEPLTVLIQLKVSPHPSLMTLCRHTASPPTMVETLSLGRGPETLAFWGKIKRQPCCYRAAFEAQTSAPRYTLEMVIPIQPTRFHLNDRVISVPRGAYLLKNPLDTLMTEGESLRHYGGTVVKASPRLLHLWREELHLLKSFGAFDFDPTPRRLTPSLKRAIDHLEARLRGQHEVGGVLLAKTAALEWLTALLQSHPNHLKDRLASSPPSLQSDPRLASALEYLRQHYAEPVTVTALAEASATSGSQLLRLFRDIHGSTPLQTLTSIRLDEAKRLILQGRPVDEVARLVGFRGGRSLRKVFARRLGRAIRPPRS